MTHRFAVVLGLALAACGAQGDAIPPAGSTSADPVVSTAVPYTDVDLTSCLQMPDSGAPTADACPGFIRTALAPTGETCSEFGGVLQPMAAPIIWSLDADADGEPEFLFDVTQNYYCDGAPSALSCGSLGCPVFLYAGRDDAWAVLGHMNAEDVSRADVLAARGGSGYGTLSGGCGGIRPCEELTHYTWDGSSYDRTAMVVRGHGVDVSPGGLWTLAGDTPVLSEPVAGAEVLDSYPAGTQMVVIGDARDAPYRYVSPCNVCERGFVATDALTQEASP